MWCFWDMPPSPFRVLTQEGTAVVEVPMELKLFLCALFRPKQAFSCPLSLIALCLQWGTSRLQDSWSQASLL